MIELQQTRPLREDKKRICCIGIPDRGWKGVPLYACMCVFVSVCVCVCEGERERERESHTYLIEVGRGPFDEIP